MSKPKNNRVWCPECGRPKMLFESESKANNFIKWNGEDIDTNGGKLRPYYCPACGGYHISSKPYKASYDHSTDALIRRYKKDVEASKLLIPKESKAEKINMESERIFNKFVREIPKTMEYTKEWLRELLDAWIKGNGVEIEQGVLDEVRHKVYKNVLKL